MTTMQISGPHLFEYPGILDELLRNRLTLDTIRYVEVKTADRAIAHPLLEEDARKVRKAISATAVLHSGETIPLTLEKLVYLSTSPEAIRQAVAAAYNLVGFYVQVLRDQGWQRAYILKVERNDENPHNSHVDVIVSGDGSRAPAVTLRGAEIVTRLRLYQEEPAT